MKKMSPQYMRCFVGVAVAAFADGRLSFTVSTGCRKGDATYQYELVNER